MLLHRSNDRPKQFRTRSTQQPFRRTHDSDTNVSCSPRAPNWRTGIGTGRPCVYRRPYENYLRLVEVSVSGGVSTSHVFVAEERLFACFRNNSIMQSKWLDRGGHGEKRGRQIWKSSIGLCVCHVATFTRALAFHLARNRGRKRKGNVTIMTVLTTLYLFFFFVAIGALIRDFLPFLFYLASFPFGAGFCRFYARIDENRVLPSSGTKHECRKADWLAARGSVPFVLHCKGEFNFKYLETPRRSRGIEQNFAAYRYSVCLGIFVFLR